MLDLEHIIREYRPTEAAVALVRDTKIALLTGISGAGKDTIKRRLLRLPSFRDIVSHTTREPRANNGQLERDGVDYHFIDRTNHARAPSVH